MARKKPKSTFTTERTSFLRPDCPLKGQCVSRSQAHRTLSVSQNHSVLQERRRQQKTEPFVTRMHHRNAIEGTQSELVRAHGLRQARYRGRPR